MNDFLQTFHVAVTPLTPIHIGCGTDFEPTNYVIRDNDILYNFDPENAELNERQKRDLQQRGERCDLLSIQKFFRDHADTFAVAAKSIMPVTHDIAQEYRNKIGTPVKTEVKKNNDIINNLYIQRTISHPYTNDPYLPGSSVKGAIRTAILDSLNDPPVRYESNASKPERNKSARLEQRLLGMDGSDYAQSAFRLVKISDIQPSGEPARLVVMTKQYKKKTVIDKTTGMPKEGGAISVRREIIAPAQYRCFTGEIQIGTLGDIYEKDKTPPHNRRIDIQSIARDCNRFYCQQMKDELDRLGNRRLTSDTWLANIRKLFSPTSEISRQMNNGTTFLIRLGMLGGAESKTFRGEGIAQIKINQGKGRLPRYQDTTTTIWLGDIDSRQKNRQPFGWALVEIQPEKDCESLKTWCARESSSYPDLESECRNILKQREAMKLKKQQDAAEKQKQDEQRRQEIEKKREEETRRAAMSEYDRTILDFTAILNKVNEKGGSGSPEATQCREILEHAATHWQNATDKNRLAQHVAPLLKKKNLNSKKFKEVLQKLRGES